MHPKKNKKTQAKQGGIIQITQAFITEDPTPHKHTTQTQHPQSMHTTLHTHSRRRQWSPASLLASYVSPNEMERYRASRAAVFFLPSAFGHPTSGTACPSYLLKTLQGAGPRAGTFKWSTCAREPMAVVVLFIPNMREAASVACPPVASPPVPPFRFHTCTQL